MSSLVGRVCLVTGGTRGVGKGICKQLVKSGATCYVTGRNENDMKKLEDEVNSQSKEGRLITVICDHTNDDAVIDLFKRIEKDSGRLDLLTNNAYSGLQFLSDNQTTPFWEQSLKGFDMVCNVGLRSHYIASQLGAKLMVKQDKGIIINISSPGGASFGFAPLYGIGKCAKDRMARDCSFQLRKHNIAFFSYWPSAVRTELIEAELNKAMSDTSLATGSQERDQTIITNTYGMSKIMNMLSFIQKVPHKKIMKMSGNVITAWKFAEKYKLTYDGGKYPPNFLRLKTIMRAYGFNKSAMLVPSFIGLPLLLFKPVAEAYNRPIFSTMLEL